MKRWHWLVLALALGLFPQGASASAWKKDSSALARLNHRLHGRVVDFTANHGHDYRMWSRSLGQKRDLYVYLPPGYDSHERYPVMILMHGFGFDEQSMLGVIPELDRAMSLKKLPPLVIAIPDGSLKGEPSCHHPGSFFINSDAGDYEDFVVHDVWDFICKRYSIRPEREARVLAGISMGGFAAYSMGIRHREHFGVAAALFPALNMRWIGATGCYFDKFDPRFWDWRTSIIDPSQVIARVGLCKVRLGHFLEPLYGIGDDALGRLGSVSPIELVDRTHLRDGQLAMYVGYGGKDEYNIDAQVESFLYLCKFRGITVHVGYDQDGRHDAATALRLLPSVIEFLNRQVGPYAPGACAPGACAPGACAPCADELCAPCPDGACGP